MFKTMLDRLRRYTKRQYKYDLVIYDDIYPHPASGFRMEEFTYLLQSIPTSVVQHLDLIIMPNKTPRYICCLVYPSRPKRGVSTGCYRGTLPYGVRSGRL